MATPQETAAVREAFDRLGDVLLHPQTIGLGANLGGTTRGRMVGVLQSMVAEAHQLASIILDMDRIDAERHPDITTMPGARVERSTGLTGVPETAISFPDGGPTFASGDGFSVRSVTITEA